MPGPWVRQLPRITPDQRCSAPLRRGLTGQDRRIRYAKDFVYECRGPDQPRYLADGARIFLESVAEPCFENPCVGGSIPPRATKNSENANPCRLAFLFVDSAVLFPVYVRSTLVMSEFPTPSFPLTLVRRASYYLCQQVGKDHPASADVVSPSM